jgi:hypothetical protein
LAVADLDVDSVDEDRRVDDSNGRFRHFAIPPTTLSVIVEMVCRETSAPWTPARCGDISPVVKPFADKEMPISSTPVR